MDSIKALIPHRDPFLFVDEIVSADENEIIGLKTFADSFFVFSGHLPERRIVPEVILIEAMAQCGGVGAKKLKLINEELCVLAMIQTARFFNDVEPGNLVTMVIKNLKVRNRGIKQSGTAYCHEQVVAEATWWCVKLESIPNSV
jgi:3-hydroxyacyl-[acyl-carrier-protein] dehydratase